MSEPIDINLLDELNDISKLHILKRETIDQMMRTLGSRITNSLGIDMVSVWLFTPEKDKLISLGEYTGSDDSFKKDSEVIEVDYPEYFRKLNENETIYIENLQERPDLLNDHAYLCVKAVTLLEIPLQIANNVVGVIRFKTLNKIKEFTEEERTYMLSLSFVFASNLEARHRRAAQHKLNMLLEEKELLVKEMNHRVKNNFSILISLLRIGKERASAPETLNTLEDYEQRVFSMLKIHELLQENDNYTAVNISQYLKTLLSEFKRSHENTAKLSIKLNLSTGEKILKPKHVVHLGLLITEILLNAIKHNDTDYNEVNITYIENNTSSELVIDEKADGFDFQEELKNSAFGLSLISDLVNDLEVDATFPTKEKLAYRFNW